MKTVEKTSRRIIIELTSDEIIKSGFENLWDDIRAIYPTRGYDLHSIVETAKGMVISIELRPSINKRSYSAMT